MLCLKSFFVVFKEKNHFSRRELTLCHYLHSSSRGSLIIPAPVTLLYMPALLPFQRNLGSKTVGCNDHGFSPFRFLNLQKLTHRAEGPVEMINSTCKKECTEGGWESGLNHPLLLLPTVYGEGNTRKSTIISTCC